MRHKAINIDISIITIWCINYRTNISFYNEYVHLVIYYFSINWLLIGLLQGFMKFFDIWSDVDEDIDIVS